MASTSETLEQLERARAALEAGAGVTGLRALIEAWRGHRSPELAELVERLSVRLAHGRALPPAKTQIKNVHNWLARARQRDLGDLDMLLEQFTVIFERMRTHPGATVLDELEQRRDDPRIGGWMVRRFMPWCVQWGDQHQPALGRILVASGDPRTRPAFDQLDNPSLLKEFEARLAELGTAAKPESSPAIDAACELLRDRIDAATFDLAADERLREAGPKSGEQLFDEVYADPSDDEARLVLSDWLQSRGDPRGELISLQYRRREQPPTPEAEAREQELIDAHAEIWLGPLARLVNRGSVEFERGFPIAARVRAIKAALVEPERDHREWATFERLSFNREMRGSGSIISPHMRAIRELDDVCDKGLFALATSLDWLPVEYLGFKGNSSADLDLQGKGGKALRKCNGLDRLRSLYVRNSFGSPERVAWLWDTKLGRQLESYVTTHHRTPLAAWTRAPTNLMRVAVVRDDDLWMKNWWMLERDGAGRWARVHLHLRHRFDTLELSTALADLPDEQLTDIRVDLRRQRDDSNPWLEQIEPLVSRFKCARVEIGQVTPGDRPPWLPQR